MPGPLSTLLAERSLAVASQVTDRGLLPDNALRAGIRTLLGRRLAAEGADLSSEARRQRRSVVLDRLSTGPISAHSAEANQQHYEVPAEFFELVLGPRYKYSCCHFDDAWTTLERAENDMLAETCANARLENGQSLLDLGCGWGSLSLYAAEHYPDSAITAVSNSASQKASILARAEAAGLSNLTVMTSDINDLELSTRFDRIISIEMFEHLANWELLLERVSSWLAPDGRAMVHVFCHRELSYFFDPKHAHDWMSTHFFTGGLMPYDGLIEAFDTDLESEASWRYDGIHYARTSDAWLANLDANRAAALQVLAGVYGADQAPTWFHRWRMFFLACSELFGYSGGTEWYVTHHRLRHSDAAQADR